MYPKIDRFLKEDTTAELQIEFNGDTHMYWAKVVAADATVFVNHSRYALGCGGSVGEAMEMLEKQLREYFYE